MHLGWSWLGLLAAYFWARPRLHPARSLFKDHAVAATTRLMHPRCLPLSTFWTCLGVSDFAMVAIAFLLASFSLICVVVPRCEVVTALLWCGLRLMVGDAWRLVVVASICFGVHGATASCCWSGSARGPDLPRRATL